MNILMLAHWLPMPGRPQETRREYRFARRLLKDHRLTLAFVAEEQDLAGRVSALRDEFGDVEFAMLPRGWATLAAAARAVTGESGSIAYFRSEALRARLAQRQSASPYDVVYVSSSSMMPYAVELDSRLPVVVDFGELDSEWWAQKAEERLFPAATFFRTEAARLRLCEAAAARRAVRSIAASPRAAGVLAAHVPDVVIDVVPDGVDQDYFGTASKASSSGSTVAIVGTLDGSESVEALARFCLTTVPSVRAALPDVRFLVASRSIPASAERLADIAGIENAGPVDDIRSLLREASVAVAALPATGGLPVAIVEAMLSGLPVVATQAAAEGLGAVAGRDLEVADNPMAFARQVIELLGSTERSAALAARGQTFARARHSWEASTARMLELIEISASSRGAALDPLETFRGQALAPDGKALAARP
ncbi:MAG TPA: glycosyltransferase [Thermoanaerobaculaceae bacterium]|nr:glycosyltransferase [Thermoanaerobaculaceae bacterium]